MEDIQLTADGSQALATLKKIQDSVDNLGGQFKKFASSAASSIDAVKKSSDNLTSATEKLRGAVAALGMASVIKSFGDYAKEVTNASNATGVAISTVDNFAKAVGKAGGNASTAVGDVIDFTAQLKEAKDGSVGAQAELERMGVTLEDLSRLSNDKLFAKTVNGLAAIGDASDRNALALKYFGRNFKDIDFKTVANTFGQSQASGKDNSESIKQMSKAVDNLNMMFSAMKQGIIQAFQPVITVFNYLIENSGKFKDQLIDLVRIATMAGMAFLWIDKVGNKLSNLGSNMKVAEELSNIDNKIKIIEGGMARATASMNNLPKAAKNQMSEVVRMQGQLLENLKQQRAGFVHENADVINNNNKLQSTIKNIVGFIKEPFIQTKSAIENTATSITKAGLGAALMGQNFKRLGEKIYDVASGTKKLTIESHGAWAAYSIGTATMKTFNAVGNTAVITFKALAVSVTSFAAALGNIFSIAAILYTALEGLNWIIRAAFDVDLLEDFWTWFNKITGETARQTRIKEAEKLNKKLKEEVAERERIAEVVNKLAVENKAAVREAIRNYAQQNVANNEQMAFNIKMIGVAEDRVQVETELFNLQQEYKKKLQDSNNEIQKQFDLLGGLKAGTEEYKRANAEIDKQRQIQSGLTKEYNKQVPLLEKLQNDRTIANAKERDRLFVLEEITKQIERQAALGDALRGANDKMVDLKFNAKISPLGNPLEGLSAVPESIKKSSRAVQVEYAKIQEEARKAALEAGRAFAAGFEDNGDGLSAEKAEELAKGLDQIAKRYKAIADAQTANLEASQTFAYGWKEAFDAYADSATNAAKKAGDAFSAVTRGMESAIDKFVETGKFSFSDMASSIIRDLIKIEMKAQAMQLWKMLGGASSSGGIGGFLGNIFGGFFADGGQPPMGKASIVGENGPELFVPRSAGTIIPNNQLGGGGQTVNNYYTTNVNNTVSALDAKSVAQLFAENKKTLFGVVESARREVPMRG